MAVSIIGVSDRIKDSTGKKSFLVQTISDGRLQMSRIAPYDLTDYCFAHQCTKSYPSFDEYDDNEDVEWRIYSPKGKLLDTVNGDVSWTSIADRLVKFDNKLGLKSRIDHT